MRRSDDPDARGVMAELACLERDHRRCEECHALVDGVVRKWLETGRLDEARRRCLRATLDELSNVYTAHIQMEEQRVFVVASHILDRVQLRDIGEEMRRRRSLATGLRPADST
jgi:hypothetical protein